ncbi:MAG: hypothetical protein ABIQ99_07545, partial [Thermoflexales bacterium]
MEKKFALPEGSFVGCLRLAICGRALAAVFAAISILLPGTVLADGGDLTGTTWESAKFLDAPITIDQGQAGKPVVAHPFLSGPGFYRGTYDGKRLVLNNTTLSNASETLDCQVNGAQMNCSWITVFNGKRESQPYAFNCKNCSAAPAPVSGSLSAGLACNISGVQSAGQASC